jgi:hypothetical protein
MNPNGSEVSECKLEYGTTTAYGSSAPCSRKPGRQRRISTCAAEQCEVLVNHAHCRRALADGGGDTLDRPGPHVAGGKHARAARFERERRAVASTARGIKVGQLQVVAGQKESVIVGRERRA